MAAHQRQLHALRAVVLRELQAKKAVAGGDVGAKTKRTLGRRRWTTPPVTPPR